MFFPAAAGGDRFVRPPRSYRKKPGMAGAPQGQALPLSAEESAKLYFRLRPKTQAPARMADARGPRKGKKAI